MEKFMPDASPKERLQVLQNTAHKVEQKEYYTPLTQADLDLKREQFTDNSIWLGSEKAKIKELVDTHKELIKPKAEESAKLLYEITTKQEKREGTLFYIADFDNSVMVTYDENGDFVESRRLRPEEKNGQATVPFPAKRIA